MDCRIIGRPIFITILAFFNITISLKSRFGSSIISLYELNICNLLSFFPSIKILDQKIMDNQSDKLS